MTLIHLVGADAATAELVAAVVAADFPEARLCLHAHLNEIAALPASSRPELLVLAGALEPDAARLAEKADDTGRLRWSVVVLNANHPAGHFETVPAGEVDATAVTAALRTALARHHLRQENARLRGDLLTMAIRINHDLKTPLNGLLATGEVLKEVLREKDPASEALAESLFRSVDEMVRLMNRVSVLLKASLPPPVLKPVSMGDAVWAARQRLESRILAGKCQIIAPDHWPEVAGVPAWLEIIWGNLLGNALEHAGYATRIELGWETHGATCRFWVRDNGKGVSPLRQRGLFRPFHTLHAPEAGRGLGLAIVQRLVSLQRGQVGYSPVPEGGSLFFFTLPALRTDD